MAVDGVKGGGKDSIYGLMADGLDAANDAFNPEQQLKKAGNLAAQVGDAVKSATGGGGGGGGGLFGGGGGGLLGGIMNIAKLALTVVCPAAGIALNLVSGLMNSQGSGGMGNDILGSVANGVLGGALGG